MLYNLLKVLHILCAVAAVGSNLTYSVWFARGAKDTRHLAFALGGIRTLDDWVSNPAYAGKTVIMVWEHKHIAKRKLEEDYPNEQVTLRQLLHLDGLKDVPKSWPDENYDFFWIVEYESGTQVPTRFRMLRQDFAAPFDNLPANGWEEAEPKHQKAGCKK